MADIIKTVGDGHGAPDYADIALWNTGEGGVDPGVGFTSIADCSGNIGVADTINGAFIRGYSVEGDTAYDGTNESSLAMIDRLTVSTTGNISDIKITSTNAFLTAFSISADNCNINRCRISHPTANGVPSVNITAAIAATTFSQCVITGGNDTVRAGFAQGAAFNKCVVLDSTDKGFEGSGGAGILTATDVYSGNATSDDYDSAQMTLSFAASSDATGSAGLQNITVANALVNVGIDDYRSKAGGPLDGTGSADYIGAFLEVSGGITGTVTQTAESFTQSAVGTITSTGATGSITQTAQSFTQSLVSSLGFSGLINQTAQSFTQSLVGTALLNITGNINQSLNSFTQSSSGTVVLNVTGTITQTVGAFTQAANGILITPITGLIAQTISGFTMSSSGSVPVQWIDKAPAITSWTNQSKTTTTWTNQAGVSTIWTDKV